MTSELALTPTDLEPPGRVGNTAEHTPPTRFVTPGAGLTALKERLLRPWELEAPDAEQRRRLRLAATEAEALSWLTPFPLLVLPVLLEECLERVRRHAAYQVSFRRSRRLA